MFHHRDTLGVDRAADEYITADILSSLEYGDPEELRCMLGECTEDELVAWIEVAQHEQTNPLCWSGYHDHRG
jgi:hypothetical protein